MHRGEPQIYGTQYLIKDDVLTLWKVQDPEGLDERRAALGLEPGAANRARLMSAEGLAGANPDDQQPGAPEQEPGG
jgi:hypothetical protein